jgi:glucokinase
MRDLVRVIVPRRRLVELYRDVLFVDLDLVDVLQPARIEKLGVRRLPGATRIISQIDEVYRLHNESTIPARCGCRLCEEQKIVGMQTAIGVDLGGSHVTAAVVTEDGAIRRQHEEDLEDLKFEAVIAALDTTIGAALKDAGTVAGIGVGSPGNIDASSGAVLYSPNFGWEDAPLGEALRNKFPVPVFVANDARCATLGEYTFGTGKLTKDFVLLTLGTGIGGGIVAGGELLLGNRWGAGEIGHHQIRPNGGFICACGKTGCFEAQASGTGLIRHAFAVASSFPRSTLLDVSREKLSSKKIRRAAQAGDGHAEAARKNFIEDLAIGLANIIAFVNPEKIALGGGVSTAGEFMLDAVRPEVEILTTMVPRGTTEIVVASLGNDAGQVGAATMAFRGGLTTGNPHAI